jgi:hypothetical protein
MMATTPGEPVERPDLQWQFDPDPEHASEIEVRFTANGPEETTVDVEHSRFERLDGGGTINDAIGGGGGWVQLLDGFVRTVSDQA